MSEAVLVFAMATGIALFSSGAEGRDAPAASAAGSGSVPASGAGASAAAPKPMPVDINAADRKALEAALRKLEGITEERARAIADGRPYRNPEDLVVRRILPPAAYDKIKSRLVASKQPQ